MSRGDGRRMMAINPAACRGLRGFGGAAPAAAPAWTPASITGVAEWWRADLGVTDAGAGAVSAWQGQIAGETLSQGTAAARPTLTTRDSQSVLSFDGGDWLRGAFGTITLGTPREYIAIFEVPATPGANSYVYEGDDTTNRTALLAGTSDQFSVFAGATLTAALARVSGTQVSRAVYNGASSELYVDDIATPAASGNTGTLVADGITVGAYATGAFGITDFIWEVILVAGALSAGDRALLGAYLDARYAGLSLTY